jgi:uncharacterized protein
MTPQERELVESLFDRLARLENAPRDTDAERAIEDGLRHAPNAIYPLVQTVLVQDEALKRADARIRELTGESADVPAGGGFLDSMRQALTGRSAATSVPTVHPGASGGPDPRWNTGGAFAPAVTPATQAQGGSFLGTAAASAAGVIGGALLLNSISSMFGHHGGNAFAAPLPSGSPSNSPWDNNSAAGSDLARDAGINDIGSGSRGGAQPAGMLDSDDADPSSLADDFSDDADADFGGGDFGGGDSA